MKRWMLGLAVAVLSSAARGETLLERGDYLVNAIMACDGCHSIRTPAGLDMAKRFAGGAQTWTTAEYSVKGSNITPDRDTGIDDRSAQTRLLYRDHRPLHGMSFAPRPQRQRSDGAAVLFQQDDAGRPQRARRMAAHDSAA